MRSSHVAASFLPQRGLRRTLAVLGIAVIPLTACFEEPVAERLRIEFTRDGAFVVTAATVITVTGNEDSNPSLERRLADIRRDYESGTDPWARRFAILEPSRERIGWERREGTLVEVVHRAEASDHDALRRFLADAGLSSDVVARGLDLEFIVIPASSGRASRVERERVESFLGTFTTAVARTYSAVDVLYSYLENRPERSLPCIASLFSDAVSAGDRRRIGDTSEHEQQMLHDIVEARRAVLEIFEVPDNEAFSINELSHRVFDPFPARFEVTVPGEPLEVEGFTSTGDGTLHVEGLGLFEALESLSGRWAKPDPIVEYVHAMRVRSQTTVSPEELLTTPPSAVAATDAEVRAAVVERLRPAPLYRVVFRVAAAE